MRRDLFNYPLKLPRTALQLAGEGGAIGRRKTPVVRRVMAPDGVWPAAAAQGGLHDRRREPSRSRPLLSAPHPAFGHLPRFRGEGEPADREQRHEKHREFDLCEYGRVEPGQG